MLRPSLLTATVLLFVPILHGQESVPPTKDYAAAAKALDTYIAAEMKAKGVPGMAIALVDGDQVVWAKGFGVSNPEKKTPASADTQWPLGSISKPITALIALLLASEKKLDFDDPVTKFVPDFHPKNPSGKVITLRHILAHQSGIVREPPVGNYFEPKNATRADLVKSLNDTAIVYEPGTKYHYSNAAVSMLGYILETIEKKPFEQVAQERIFGPLGMTRSTYAYLDPNRTDSAKGEGWTRYGKTYPMPMKDYRAIASAGAAMASVNDVGKLIAALCPGNPSPIPAEGLKAAYTTQFPEQKAERTFGLGFILGMKDGKRIIGHSGAVNGCVAELDVLPDDKLGVIVFANLDSASMVPHRIAEAALSQALAIRAGEPLPPLESTTPLPIAVAKELAGRFKSEKETIDVWTSGNRAWMVAASGGVLKEIRAAKDGLIVDDQLSYGPKVKLDDTKLTVGDKTYERIAIEKPAPCPERWRGLIGEYGPDENVLFVLEKDGKLHVLIEWFFLYPLEDEVADRFRFPPHGLYASEPIVFRRNAGGKGTSVNAAAVEFTRRPIDGEDGQTFRIKPYRPVEEVRKEALVAKPPVEMKEKKADLVDLAMVDPMFKFDIRYASDNNFVGVPFYTSARAFFQRPAAEALKRASKKLAAQGYGILVHDSYRPWHVTKMFFEVTPPAMRIFVANPQLGSRHNRGCAIDLTLYDLKTGKLAEMVGGYDEFSDRSYPDYLGGTSLARWHRQLLRDAMESENFTVFENEWWHYDFGDWRAYPIGNARFEDIK
jgi:CubicO group peptidase (beta-lactamase class C family)/D-alanyl-D-alanine dipeptidase